MFFPNLQDINVPSTKRIINKKVINDQSFFKISQNPENCITDCYIPHIAQMDILHYKKVTVYIKNLYKNKTIY